MINELFKKEYQESLEISEDWLQSLKSNSWDNLNKNRWPTFRKNENWRYTNPELFFKDIDFNSKSNYLETDIEKFIMKDMINIVIKDGKIYNKDLDDALDISDIWNNKNRELLENDKSGDNFKELNSALFNSGVVIRVKKDKKPQKAIHLIHVTDGSIFIKNIILLEKFSNATILESIISKKDGVTELTNISTTILLEESSKLTHFKSELLKENHNSFSSMEIEQKKDSSYTNFYFTNGGKYTRNEIRVDLNEEGAETTLNGIYLLKDKYHNDNSTLINHFSPNTKSKQLYKGILDDSSHAIFDGKIIVHPDAQQVSSEQLNQNLVLNDKARIESKPQLEIGADDVKCSHGTTIGQLDSRQIFYFQSRGFSKERAVEILSKAFINEMLKDIKNDIIKDYFSVLVELSFYK